MITLKNPKEGSIESNFTTEFLDLVHAGISDWAGHAQQLKQSKHSIYVFCLLLLMWIPAAVTQNPLGDQQSPSWLNSTLAGNFETYCLQTNNCITLVPKPWYVCKYPDTESCTRLSNAAFSGVNRLHSNPFNYEMQRKSIFNGIWLQFFMKQMLPLGGQ